MRNKLGASGMPKRSNWRRADVDLFQYSFRVKTMTLRLSLKCEISRQLKRLSETADSK